MESEILRLKALYNTVISKLHVDQSEYFIFYSNVQLSHFSEEVKNLVIFCIIQVVWEN